MSNEHIEQVGILYTLGELRLALAQFAHLPDSTPIQVENDGQYTGSVNYIGGDTECLTLGITGDGPIG